MEKPVVSVICIAYNHGKYIKDALEGFVSQKTRFPFEVIIHDDASTDGTTSIIEEYAEKYPHIIKPIYQKENQYSKGVPFISKYILPIIQGDYIALCEGDDYWCDENKLQYQVDWLDKHPDYVFCTHNTKVINLMTGREYLHRDYNTDRDLTVEEILEKPGIPSHTSSYMYRREFAVLPDDFYIRGFGDYPRGIYLSMCGKVRYLNQVMSVYRYMTDGSWSARTYHTAKKVYDLNKNIVEMLRRADNFSNNKYSLRIQEVIHKYEFRNCMITNDLPIMKKKYADLYGKLSIREKSKIWIKYYFPHAIQLYKKLRDRKEKQ